MPDAILSTAAVAAMAARHGPGVRVETEWRIDGHVTAGHEVCERDYSADVVQAAWPCAAAVLTVSHEALRALLRDLLPYTAHYGSCRRWTVGLEAICSCGMAALQGAALTALDPVEA